MLICFYSVAQDLPKNLVYSNENLFFEDILKVGDHKLLRITPMKRENKRFIYLLNKHNLVVDTMKVSGNDNFLIRSDSIFSIRSLGEYVDVKIHNDRFIATVGIATQSDFNYQVIRLIFFVGDYLFGSLYLPEKDCESYRAIPTNSFKSLVLVPASLPKEYNFDDLDTLFLLGVKRMEKFTGQKDAYAGVPFNTLIPEIETCKKRIRDPYFGWNAYSRDGDDFFMYEMSNGTLYQFDISNALKLKNKFELPIKDRATEGWKYLFDQTSKKHYMAKRITHKGEPTKKRKKNKDSYSYSYELYSLDMKSNNLKPLFKMGFEPKMVDNGLVYEIVAESKKGSAIYFHPLDPNYKYQKSTLIYSNND